MSIEDKIEKAIKKMKALGPPLPDAYICFRPVLQALQRPGGEHVDDLFSPCIGSSVLFGSPVYVAKDLEDARQLLIGVLENGHRPMFLFSKPLTDDEAKMAEFVKVAPVIVARRAACQMN